MFLINILKDLIHLYYIEKCETELRNLFFFDFSMVTVWCWWLQRSLKAWSGTWTLQKPNQGLQYLTETRINHDEIHHIRNNWLSLIFFSPEDSHTKGLLIMLHQGLEVFTQVDTDAKRKFVSFNVIPSNGRVLCVYAPSECNTREQFDRKNFFEGLQNYVKKKSEGNENKINLLNVNCNMDK